MELKGNIERTIYVIVFMLMCARVNSSRKKGLAVNPRNFLCGDINAFDNMAWWYNWGANFGLIIDTSGCQNVVENVSTFVPMVWGYGSYFSDYFIYDETQFLLSFNEPNHYNQSRLKPEEAAQHWPEVEALAAGRPIISPSAAPCGGNCISTTDWFDWFFSNCSGCRVDYLATHAFYCNAEYTISFLQDLYDRYQRKIWLTEFACKETTSIYDQLNLMDDLLPKLEESDFIYRYAWFAHRIPYSPGAFVTSSASLLESDTSTLTDLGHMYNDFMYDTTSTSPPVTPSPQHQGVCPRRIRK